MLQDLLISAAAAATAAAPSSASNAESLQQLGFSHMIQNQDFVSRAVLVIMVVMSVGAWWYTSRPPTSMLLTGTVTTNHIVVSPQITGRLDKLMVAEGDVVKADQLLAVLEPEQELLRSIGRLLSRSDLEARHRERLGERRAERLRQLGHLLERSGRRVPEPARDLTAAMQADFDGVATATADLPKPRVFYELDATTDLYTAADDSFIAEMIELAGGDPITTGSTTDFAISLEKLVTADPEVIVLGDAVYGVTPEAVASRPGWDVMTAVKTDQIRGVNDLIVTRPGPRLVDGLRELALAIHPEATVPSSASVAP